MGYKRLPDNSKLEPQPTHLGINSEASALSPTCSHFFLLLLPNLDIHSSALFARLSPFDTKFFLFEGPPPVEYFVVVFAKSPISSPILFASLIIALDNKDNRDRIVSVISLLFRANILLSSSRKSVFSRISDHTLI